MPTSDDEWLELELASAIHVPRVTSKTVRFAMQKMLAVHHEYASRKYSDDVEKEDVEADSKAKRERFTLALHDARDALQAYLREAALR